MFEPTHSAARENLTTYPSAHEKIAQRTVVCHESERQLHSSTTLAVFGIVHKRKKDQSQSKLSFM